MPTLRESLAIALSHHQAGRLAEAEQIYRHVLDTIQFVRYAAMVKELGAKVCVEMSATAGAVAAALCGGR
jgi:hypothetical protein